jgi:uncharacterized protein YdaU (DUF1376 family)
MDKPPAFQLYAADFTMDTDTWTLEEVGLYVRLLFSEWVNGPLPNDPKKLQRIARTNKKTFNLCWTLVSTKFVSNCEGKLQNLRLEYTRQKQQVYLESQRLKGFKSGKVRANPGSSPVRTQDEPKGEPNRTLLSSSSSSLAFTNVKAGATTPPDSLEEEQGAEVPFSVGDPKTKPKEKPGHFEKDLTARDNGTLQKILEACEGFKGRKDFNPFQFIQRNKNRHPKALLQTLERLAATLARGTPIDAPWPYAEKIVRIESKNFREAEAITAHKRLMEELRKMYPRDD